MITAGQAAAEILRRRQAIVSAKAFAEAVDVPGRSVDDDDDEDGLQYEVVNSKLAEHHKLICDEAVACFLKPFGRTMLFFPPGSAKSTYASVVVPAFLMGKYEKTRIGLFSYGAPLARKFGRRTRSIVMQPRYSAIMNGVKLLGGNSAAHEFSLTNGSEYMATGILGGATGNRFNFLVIDDPVKGRQDADSEAVQKNTWDAYEDDLKTRLVPGGSIMLIMTRWNENDIAGRILPDDWNGESGDIVCKDGNTWRVVCVQAECETDSDPLGRARGEYLWPEWFTKQHWDQFRSNSRTWGSLCQQLPRPADGDMFKPDRIEIVDEFPAGRITWVRGWDMAATEGGGAYTVGFKLGRHQDGWYCIDDVRREQYGPDKRDALLTNTAKLDGRRVVQDYPQDPGQAGKSQVLAWVKALPGYIVKFGPESGDKETRAEPMASQVNAGNFKMRRADWNAPLISELRAFPNGTYKDQGDAGSRAFNRLLEMAGKMAINPELLNRMKRS